MLMNKVRDASAAASSTTARTMDPTPYATEHRKNNVLFLFYSQEGGNGVRWNEATRNRACGQGPTAHIRFHGKISRRIQKRIAEGDWQIEAHYPGAEIRYIKGLKSKAEVDEWLQGTRRIDWLRSQGYAK
jgi:hypothetical protein